MAKTNSKVTARSKRVQRIRIKISGTQERPRLRVFRSNRHIYAQIIDDTNRSTLLAMSTDDKNFDAESRHWCQIGHVHKVLPHLHIHA